MKKILAMAIGLAAVACVASAETYSQNAVGFINIPAQPGKLYAMSIPFYNMDTEDGMWPIVSSSAIVSNLPNNSTIYWWDGASAQPGWHSVRKRNATALTWADPADQGKALVPGEFFFVKIGGNAAKDIVLSGEVPDDDSLVVNLNQAGNLSAVGNPYPVAYDFTKSSIATNATAQSAVYFWDPDLNNGNGGWTDPVRNRKAGVFTSDDPEIAKHFNLQPGDAFFFKTATKDTDKQWTVEKPYNWPGNPVPAAE